MAKGKETQMQQKNTNVKSKQVHENMAKLRLRRKRDYEDREKHSKSFQKQKAKLNDIEEEDRNDTTIEWMVTESDIEAEGGIESIRQEVENLQREYSEGNASNKQDE